MRFLPASLLYLSLVVPASAQVLPGRQSEIIGLHRWTLPMITDTLAKYAPNSPLASQHCIAVLLDPLRFTDAAWIVYGRGQDNRPAEFTQILLLEPGDSLRQRLHPAQRDTLPVPDAWLEATPLAQVGPGFLFLIQDPSLLSDTPEADVRLRQSPTGVHLATFVRNQRTPEAVALAVDVLHRDARPAIRRLALLVLASHPELDTSWHAIVAAQRDPDFSFRFIVPALTQGMARFATRDIDWSPAAEDLAAVLDGTNLWALGPTIQLLNRTHVRPELASALLRGRGLMLLASLKSADLPTQTEAHALLQRLAGRDWGLSPDAWEAWLAKL